MSIAFVRWTAVIGVIFAFAFACLWLLRRPSDLIIPAEYQGRWLDVGADCQDTEAQARISSTTVDYDALTFKADRLLEQQTDVVMIAGEAFPNGRAERVTVALRLRDDRSKLFIGVSGAHDKGPLTRCSASERS